MGDNHLSPKEVASRLTEAGIETHEKMIRRRCRLPVGNKWRIYRNPEFPGRYFIPVSELQRLLSRRAEVSA